MPEYMIAYHGKGDYDDPEKAASGQERWRAWVESLGDAILNPGTPLMNSKTVGPDGGNG